MLPIVNKYLLVYLNSDFFGGGWGGVGVLFEAFSNIFTLALSLSSVT